MRALRSRALRSTAARRAGLTIMELSLTMALVVVVSMNAYWALESSTEAAGKQTREAVLEDQARLVLRRIAYAIMGANRESLITDAAAPLSTSDIRFQVNLGIQDGEVVWSNPEEVGQDDLFSQVYWSQDPDTAAEQRVVWTNLVAPYLEGEIPNGMDDNGNGLIDEKGLCFSVDRNAVKIRMTLQRVTEEGELALHFVETTVTCRNLPDEDE